ncbi:MAG: chorismate mutase [Methanospirillaceae archaeon]|nr:chorismate mutase [Methanospirillaceae archaeon]
MPVESFRKETGSFVNLICEGLPCVPMTLADLRREIEAVDEEIIRLIIRRQEISRMIAHAKQEIGSAIRDETRAEAVITHATGCGKEAGLDPVYIHEIFRNLIRMSEDLQYQIRKEKDHP